MNDREKSAKESDAPAASPAPSSAPSRRGFLAAAYGFAAAAGADFGLRQLNAATTGTAATSEAFYAKHQSGIVTPLQKHTYFAAFDLIATDRREVVSMLRAWTAACARMTAGKTESDASIEQSDDASNGGEAIVAAAPAPPTTSPATQPDNSYGAGYGAAPSTGDSGEAIGLAPARLTITFGFGTGLFVKMGRDRYGLAHLRPGALVDLPHFPGDQLVEALSDGDISVQACADDPQVAFHAVRQLSRIGGGIAKLRWSQTGFVPHSAPGQTPRNLMGFKDGTSNVSPSDAAAMGKFVWAGGEAPAWMRGGTYVVVRRIRMALEHWDRAKVSFQQQTFGRQKLSGAPLGGKNEFDAPDFDAADKNGNSIIPDNSHVRLAHAVNNDGARIFRRPYSYNDGANFTSERWPPWRQGIEFDAGLLFICYQRDPRTGFIRIFENLSKLDMLNQFVTHTGGGLFACPGGAAEGEYIGQRLFEDARS